EANRDDEIARARKNYDALTPLQCAGLLIRVRRHAALRRRRLKGEERGTVWREGCCLAHVETDSQPPHTSARHRDPECPRGDSEQLAHGRVERLSQGRPDRASERGRVALLAARRRDRQGHRQPEGTTGCTGRQLERFAGSPSTSRTSRERSGPVTTRTR